MKSQYIRETQYVTYRVEYGNDIYYRKCIVEDYNCLDEDDSNECSKIVDTDPTVIWLDSNGEVLFSYINNPQNPKWLWNGVEVNTPHLEIEYNKYA